MKVKEILKQKHTILGSVDGYYEHQGLTDYTQATYDLETILFVIGHKYNEAIELLRKLPYHSDKQRQYKKEFPVWFVGGTFPFQKTEDKDILTYSNILAIDVDKKDNPEIDIEQMRQKLFELPYVFAVFKSISGEGIYALLLLEDGKYTKEYYKYIDKLWYQQYNIVIDHQCTNIGRKRFISYEENIKEYIKDDDIDIVPWKLKYIEKPNETIKHEYVDCSKYKTSNKDNIEWTRKAIWKLLNDGYSVDDINTTNNQYSVWYYIGCDFRIFSDGYDMYLKFSQNSSKYSDDIGTINKKWQQTSIRGNIDDICRKWCGICKNKYGKDWFK